MAKTSTSVRSWIPSRRLVAAFILLGFLPLATLTYSSLVFSQRAVKHEVDARVRSVGASTAAFVSHQLDSISRGVSAAATDPDIRAGLAHPRTATPAMQSEVQGLLDARPELRAVVATDATGKIAAIAPTNIGLPLGTDLSTTHWFPEVRNSTTAVISDAYTARSADRLRVVVVAVPVSYGTGPSHGAIGYLAVSYSLPMIQSAVTQLAQDQGLNLTIVDGSGTIVAAPNLNATDLRSIAADPRFAAGRRGLSGVSTVGPSNDRKVSAYQPIAATDWTVISEVGEKGAFVGLNQLRLTVITVAGLLVVILLVALALAARLDARRRDVDRELAQRGRALADSEQRFRTSFVQAPIGMARLDSQTRIVEANNAFYELLGRTRADLVGRLIGDITHPEDALEEILRVGAARGDHSFATTVEAQYLHGDGHLIWALVSASRLHDIDGAEYTLIQSVDITDRKQAEVQLNRKALHDSLTGLPNRVLLEERIDHAISRLTRDDPNRMAVLFIDLDGFKRVNDEFGHRVGDDVLREIAARIEHVIRPSDTVARLGGDEFVVLCEDLPNGCEDIALEVAGRIIDVVAEPGTWGERTWQIGASIGVTRPRGMASSAAILLAEADAAMYRAKQGGKSRVECYDSSMELARRDTGTSALLDNALAEDRLRVFYQPVVDLVSGKVLGAEALLRMVSLTGELLPPSDFLPAAEARGNIIEYGRWTLRQACTQAATWRATLPGGDDFTIAVNISVKEIEDSGFLSRVDDALAVSGLPPHALTIELTESAFLRDQPLGRAALRGLRERGVQLALDDFGTGFSSLSYLRRFPVDVIKIDRSFIADLLGDREEARVTQGLIALARTMETLLIAEGVEQQTQSDRLVDLGCNVAQGYLLGRPVPSEVLWAMASAAAGGPSDREPAIV